MQLGATPTESVYADLLAQLAMQNSASLSGPGGEEGPSDIYVRSTVNSVLKTALSSLKMTATLCRATVIMMMTCAVAGNTVMFDTAPLLPILSGRFALSGQTMG